jgi:hypothetical protein
VQFTVNKIELNVPLDDALFTMPVPPAAKPDTKGSGSEK